MKIYILGDSFTDNLFKHEIDYIKNNVKRESVIYKYIKLLEDQNLPTPLHFEDYLKLWGHEVINLGTGGCSNDSIYHQFTQIKEPFDRLIVNWTAPVRFDWYDDKNYMRTFTGGMTPGTELTTTDKLLIEQGINRSESKFLRKKTQDMISFLINKYEDKKPIIWSPFEDVDEMIQNIKGHIWNIRKRIFYDEIPERKLLEIDDETNKKINDKHFGRYGNFYTALVFNTILEHTKDIEHDGYYTKDSILISKIVESIKSSQHNIIEINHSI